MFTTLSQRILLGVYIFILISIPVGAYLASQATQIKSKASGPQAKTTATQPKTATSSAKNLEKLSGSLNAKPTPATKPPPAGEPVPSAPVIATSFGPTLSLKVQIDGRAKGNQAAKLFVGIISGAGLQNPQYLLSFTLNLPASGEFDNLSLAGLTVGSTYTAILKGDAQIATSSAFVMNPAVTNLNSGRPLSMLSGDLNQDNVINNSDLQIVQASFGSSSGSKNWNPAADLNADGVINSVDLSIINKNMNKTGATGTWYSPPPVKNATPSGSLTEEFTPPSGSPSESSGYWIWLPK